jgi:hypothetical protein
MALIHVIQPGRPPKVYKLRHESDNRDFKRLYWFEYANVEWLASHFLGESTETRVRL